MIITDQELKTLLIKNNLLDEKGFADITEYAKNTDITINDALVEKNVVTDENLGMLLADYLKIPFVTLSKMVIPPDVFGLLPERLARKEKVIIFGRDQNGIKVAMSDPRNVTVLEMITRKTGQRIIPHLATERDIVNTYHLYRKNLQETFDNLFKKFNITDEQLATVDIPVEKMVDMLINHANQEKSSDIHIEPEEKNSLVRFRIDGVLHDMLLLPKHFHDRIVTRIKVMAKLRTDEHLAAQDGKMRVQFEEENLDIRVSILPIVEGEKIVLRLLSTHSRQFSLLDLGMSQNDLTKVTRAFSKSYGMILSTGPTGSGKSTSIYSILKILNTRDKNITTIEDPVEYRIKGVNQIQVNVKTNLTFANGLRSILRQDPNIIFVGEIRDNETAGIGINAALTGHLVLSTLHTNDASTTLPRLTDMKVEPFLVASTVNCIIAQRLIRKICDMCKTSIIITQNDLAKNIPLDVIKKHFSDKQEVRVYKGAGCKVCHGTGYSGRIGVFEVLEVSNPVKKLIVQKVESTIIAQQAIKEGMVPMLEDGLDKVVRGVTTIEEVLRVTKSES